MGKASRDKGGRAEREVVRRHKELGVHAERVPLSGAAGGSFSGNVVLYPFGTEEGPLVTEVKARRRAAGFKVIEAWLGENDALFLRRDRADPLVVLPWRTWARLMARMRGC